LRSTFGRVHDGVEVPSRLGGDVAGADGDGFDAALATSFRRVDGVLGEDHRIVVGEGDAAAAGLLRGLGDAFGAGAIAELFDFARLSQFWQNRQPRLQPAVPKLKTLVPGKK
jgi:hypothetical protein